MERSYILLVEDDPDDEALALRAFDKSGIHNEVIVVCDGVQALNYMLGKGEYSSRHSRQMPAVILLDLKLPKVDGLEVLQMLRNDKRTKIVPVVVFTSSKEEQDLISSYNLGVNSYIRKPVDFDEFSSVLKKIGLYWLTLNEPPPTPSRNVEQASKNGKNGEPPAMVEVVTSTKVLS